VQSIALDADGKFLYAVSGSQVNGSAGAVAAFTVDENTGALTQIAASYAIPAGALAAVVDPSGNFLYVAAHDGNRVSLFQINPSTGALSNRTDIVVAKPAAIAITESLP